MAKPAVTVEILSRLSLLDAADYLSLVRHQLENLPEYYPRTINITGKTTSFPESAAELVPKKGDIQSVLWRKHSNTYGFWSPICFSSDGDFTHGKASLHTNSLKHQHRLIEFFRRAHTSTEVAFAYLDALTPQYLATARDNGWAQYGSFSLYTYMLSHYLPDMPWATLFGPEYIALFGRDRLLTAPVYKVEELADDAIYVQLTPDMNDIVASFAQVCESRDRAKRHLGYDCFYQKEKMYHWDKNINNKSGRPYRAPVFTLVDQYRVLAKQQEVYARRNQEKMAVEKITPDLYDSIADLIPCDTLVGALPDSLIPYYSRLVEQMEGVSPLIIV